MDFVRSADDCDRIAARIRRPRFADARVLTARFRTDPAVVERLLPPGLEPTDDPLASAEVVRVGRSNCVGPFDGGGLYVRARHGTRTGSYCLAMPMSTDAAVRWGRATLGEPKKLATVEWHRDGGDLTGRIDRDGRILAIDATLGDEGEPRETTGTVFHYKYQPAVDGDGFHADPALVGVRTETSLDHVRRGSGTLDLGTTAHDPLGRLPVEAVTGITYVTGEITVSAEVLATVDPDTFRPYAFGVGMDDWLALGDT